MSSDNASSEVTCTSISSDSYGPSCCIPLVNAGELPGMNPYEEVAQQRHAPPLSHAYVPDPIELDERVPVYVLEPEHPEYHVPSDDDMKEDSIDYPDESEDDNEDPKEDPKEDHTDYPANGGDSDDEPFDDYNDDDDIDDEDKLEPPMSASMEARIAEHATVPIPPTSPAYDQAPLGHRTIMIRIRDDIPEEDMPPRRRFVLSAPLPGCDVAEVGQGLIHSLGHDAWTIARATDRAEDVGYVRALQDFEHRMMTSIEEVNLRVSYQAQVHRRESKDFYIQLHDAHTDHRDIRLEIDVVRGQRTTYETELHERQSAEDLVARQMVRIHVLEARAQIDTVEDTGSSCYRIIHVTRQGANYAMTPESIQAVIDGAIQRNSTHTQDDASQSSGGGLKRPVQPARACSYTDFMKCLPLNFKGTKGVVGLSQWLEKMKSIFYISGCVVDNQVKFATCTNLVEWSLKIKKPEIELWNLKVMGNDVAAYTQRFQELALMCTKVLADETEKIDKYINGPPDNIHGNVMSARPKTLNDAIELASDLMDQKLRTYVERQNDNKRKADDSSRNNQQQQPYKKQNIARAYTVGPSKKKTYTRNLPLNWPKLKNCMNGNGNGVAQGRAYALGGKDASPDSNVITSTFLLYNRYATILFDTVIICDEKIVRVPFGREMLIFQGNGNNQREESQLNIILCTKAQEYLSKECDVFLAHIATKEAKDKSEGKQLEDVSMVREFPKVFLEDLPGIPSARQVEFQIDLVPGAKLVARAPYRLAPSEMKELTEQLQELSDKGFIRPSSSP
uniref:Putative reverse transcriptase domain-containing protein n=1 Tax=Tanacetum cinerariifolium TaxID=118510 RepID=A0A6L2KB08_TANCI|nr:putative reverse transcriptase domain-containing protein [Tanacetum cinerariifolium]